MSELLIDGIVKCVDITPFLPANRLSRPPGAVVSTDATPE